MIRAVFLNHIHSDSNHVSAMRMRSFARSFSDSGHQIILLSESLNRHDAAKSVSRVEQELTSHDWSQPFFLACPPEPSLLLSRARNGEVIFGLRQAILASAYVFRSGVFTDWFEGSSRYLPMLGQNFRPDVVWGTFGNTDAWNIARRLADLSGCPWVADLKDNWGAFLPTGLGRLMAARYRDAAHMTVFSKSHLDEASRWFDQEKTVIYSGFNDVAVAAPPEQAGPFRILLTGSIYDDAYLTRFIRGLRDWLEVEGNKQVILSYAGNDGDRVRRHTACLEGLCETNTHDFLPFEELHAMQKTASLNVYMRKSRNLFQHKILELLAAGRPVLSFPGEGGEATAIAKQVGGSLLSCDTEDQVFQALQKVSSQEQPAIDGEKMQSYSWASQAGDLETVFRKVIGDKH